MSLPTLAMCSLDKPKTRDTVAQKLGLARTIVVSLANNKIIQESKPQNNEEIVELIKMMTYVDKLTIRAILQYYECKPKISFQYCLSKTIANTDYYTQITYEQLRKIIYSLYTSNEAVPTKSKILTQIKKENYTIGDLNQDLKANRFILKKLANTKKALIVEDPMQIKNRIIYLNKMRSFRLQNRLIVYITYKENFSIALTRHSILMYAFHKNLKHIYNFLDNLIPCMPRLAVIVLDSKVPVEWRKTPDQYSTKQSMKEWLIVNNFDFEEDAHTAELYAIIRKFEKRIPPHCAIGSYLEDRGFTVVSVPPELPVLSYFNPIFKQIAQMKQKREETCIQMTLRTYGTYELSSLENQLQGEEKRVYGEDLETERIVDLIGKAASHNVFLNKDLKNCEAYVPDFVPRYIIL